MNPIELGKFIATLRNEKNLTQEELAEKLYIDKRKISRWECGTSVPEFEMLINLSEILDVSLYELSICKRIPKEKLSNNIINKFKGLKDFKKYCIKKIIKIVLLVIVAIFFLITAFYTFKYSGSAKIYELKTLNSKYDVDGNYIQIEEHVVLNITSIRDNETKNNLFSETDVCDFFMYNNNYRFLYYEKSTINVLRHIISYNDDTKISNPKESVTFHAVCYDKNLNQNKEHKFNFKLVKKYDNNLF